jgi:hypothetical protein
VEITFIWLTDPQLTLIANMLEGWKGSLFNAWCWNNWFFFLTFSLFLVVYVKAIHDFHIRNNSLLRNLKLLEHNGIKLEINTEEINTHSQICGNLTYFGIIYESGKLEYFSWMKIKSIKFIKCT